MCSLAWPLIYRNCASRSGCWRPSAALALPCRLKCSSRSSLATVGADTLCPARPSAAARFRSDKVVQRSGDSGSPREPGSTRPSSASTTPGSVSDTLLRPPPGARARRSGSPPDSSSATPAETVTALTPAASATALIPPWPSDRASAPSASRRCRSSRCGSSAANLAASPSTTSTAMAIPQACPTAEHNSRLFLNRY